MQEEKGGKAPKDKTRRFGARQVSTKLGEGGGSQAEWLALEGATQTPGVTPPHSVEKARAMATDNKKRRA